MRVALVVDDDVNVRRLMRRVLERRGFQVRLAENAYAAVGSLRRQAPDIVILDLHMPGADGFLVMDWLRNVPTARDLPVVVLSSEDPLRIATRARAAGASAVLSKLAPLDVITEAIELIASPTAGVMLH